MVVIGVTGTKGKTSAANFIWACLNSAGDKAGLISTAVIRIGDKEFLNKYHMTMPGSFVLQKLISQMAKEGCKYCVIETTSEGIKQHRQKAIFYDIVVFTNLTPEHLPSHGNSFENYKKAKGKLFATLSNSAQKTISGKKIEKVIIANYDSPHKDYFLNFKSDKKITYGLNEGADYVAKNINDYSSGVEFSVNSNKYQLKTLGKFNVYNALPAIVTASIFGFPAESIQKGFGKLQIIPGRMERIDEGQDFLIFVDYAHEKESMNAVLETAKNMVGPKKVIVLLGAEGGGRDKTKRPLMGELAGKKADFVIVSNVDPYDDGPLEIIEDIAKASEKVGKVQGKDLFPIEDRREGIKKALSLAKAGDIVLITGKGAEQSMIIKGKKIPWDDRIVVREETKRLIGKNG